ncbi:hypothetical protein SAMN05216249_11564 [Acetitomaculum ruminis DSM 5522]|uniref:Uncharacterized protein n=1 Tax=Acetitomaculum ruminis DSM 5522 TaxID=1120918 RepID=A0A1I0ZJ52_9FIRM|nr:hypothetical protein [Acetitomaculum ruminis]SFB25382.1 hypothetical protein SAMN05216249_11564 [Acetitomaculum ruminis DSM 5522]
MKSMKTKDVPVMIMLLSGFICSTVCILNNYELFDMLRALIIVLVLFYIIGLVAKRVLNKFFSENINQSLEEQLNDEEMEGIKDLEEVDGVETKAERPQDSQENESDDNENE